MPADVINCIHVLARRARAGNQLTFDDRLSQAIEDADDSDDESYHPNADDDDHDSDHDSSPDTSEAQADDDDIDDFDNDDDTDLVIPPILGVTDGPAAPAGADNDDGSTNGVLEDEEDNNGTPEDDEDVMAEDVDADEVPGADEDKPKEDEPEPVPEEDEDETEPVPEEDKPEPVQPDVASEMDARYGARTSQYGLRPRKPRDYGHLHATLEHTVMTQMNMKKGLLKFEDAGVDAVMKELKQLDDRKILAPKTASEMSAKEQKRALQYSMFLKQKRNGTIKGRGCADGRKQRAYTLKEEVSLLTIAIESVMLSSVIDAMEGRDVATVDIPGAFLQADMEDTVHMKLEGKMAELLVKIDPKMYREYVEVV